MLSRTAMIVLEDAGMAAAVLDLQLIRQADADGLVAIPVGEADSQGVLLVCGNAVALATVAALPKHFARMGELAGRLPPTNAVIGSENSVDETAGALPSRVRRAAHEINNPLGIIKNYLAILKVKLGDDAPISDELRIIYEELDRIVRIVRGLSRVQVEAATVGETADLNALIQDLVKVTQPTWLSKGIEVATVLTPGLAHLTNDRDKLKQIVLNLMLNAIEATPPGGVVRIETAALLNQRHEHFIEVLVSDSGSGIAPDIAKQIFDPLDTAKGDGHAGLGLSIVKSLTESMQGSIIFKTSASGTTFQILLPTN
jgi:signal transduction histidine kinase